MKHIQSQIFIGCKAKRELMRCGMCVFVPVAVVDLDSLPSPPQGALPTLQTQLRASTYLSEKRSNRLTRTEANNAAEAPDPLNAGHGGEHSDPVRMQLLLLTFQLFRWLSGSVCLCAHVCLCMFSDIHTPSWPIFPLSSEYTLCHTHVCVSASGVETLQMASLHRPHCYSAAHFTSAAAWSQMDQ